MLTAESTEIQEFLKAWHDNERRAFEALSPESLDYDEYKVKRALTRRRYIALDYGPAGNWSGRYLVDRLTHKVYTIKAYGVPGYYCGTLESLTMRLKEQSALHTAGGR